MPDVTRNLPQVNKTPKASSKYLSSPPPPLKVSSANSSLYVSPSKHHSKSRQKSGSGARSSEHQPLLLSSSANGEEVSDDEHADHSMTAAAHNLSGADESDFVHLSCNHFDSDPEFNEIVKMVEFAIDHNILPQRIYEGSSGSYFCKNSQNVTGFILFYTFRVFSKVCHNKTLRMLKTFFPIKLKQAKFAYI